MSDSASAADALRGRAASARLVRFGAAGLRLRDLPEPALERRAMAFPEALRAYRSGSKQSAQGHSRCIEQLEATAFLLQIAGAGNRAKAAYRHSGYIAQRVFPDRKIGFRVRPPC